MSQRSEKLYAVILRVLLFLGLAVATHGIFYCYQVNMTESWPRVEGVILESYLDKSTSDGSSRYKAKIHYSYEINGSMYESSRVSFGDVVTKGYAEKIVEKYPEGLSAYVYYDPKSHSDSVLSPGINFIVMLYPLFGVFFIVLSSTLLIYRKKMFGWTVNTLESLKSN